MNAKSVCNEDLSHCKTVKNMNIEKETEIYNWFVYKDTNIEIDLKVNLNRKTINVCFDVSLTVLLSLPTLMFSLTLSEETNLWVILGWAISSYLFCFESLALNKSQKLTAFCRPLKVHKVVDFQRFIRT